MAGRTGRDANETPVAAGMEFPAICVVMSTSTAKGIIDFLTGDDAADNEEARKIYVGASRAQRLLAIALPRTQAPRLRDKIAASKKKGLWMGGTVPFGYQPDGRSLKIDETEAPIIRQIHDLYLQHGSVRAVAEEAEDLGYRTRARPSVSGTRTGGTPFSRGHVYQILTNPLYAGRIRHRDKVYPGQHPAILDPVAWDALQERLAAEAARTRGRLNAAERSPLVGKLFDETGDRLAPSHSRKNGKHLRYYISRRLVTDRRERHPDAWRLPARDLETGIARMLRDHLMKPTVLKWCRKCEATHVESRL